MNEPRVAVVTGANRGIGLEICRQLAAAGDIKVMATSRDEAKGRAAVAQLSAEGLRAEWYQLDVTDAVSIRRCVDDITTAHQHIDILINNAGIFPDTQGASASSWPSVFDADLDTMRRGMETNVYGPLRLCQEIVPHMKKRGYGRIVNMSSGMGQLTHMNGGCPSYRLSKAGLNALTRILSEELEGTNILVNCMCPGWVRTDMGGPNATRELPEGADTAVYLATLPEDGPTGGFFRDRKPFEW
ncbi:MAG: SDR family oxidoreductase [Candidatus Omnitrophica bacterium]|nr:SDR family oxidoreductase [Candidatus Omnitrophota bacterium]